jgi:tetratricopeptide (TPR) repeat protein
MAEAAQSYLGSGQANYEAGLRSARYAAGTRALASLFDRHFASFGYPTDHFKRLTLHGLRDKVSWEAALDSLTRAVSLEPQITLWQHELALVLEQIGKIEDALLVRQAITRLDPDSTENNYAIGRLYEHTKPEDEDDTQASFNEKYYANVSKSLSQYLLAISRYAALRGPQALRRTTLEELKVRVRDALVFSPNDIALNLAMGFVHLAEENRQAARRRFLAASLLGNQPGLVGNCDQWSLAYAQAFLLGLIPASAPPLGTFLTVDPINLLLARASLLWNEGAINSALAEYDSAISRLLPLRLPSTFHAYKGYKIISHERIFYAVPDSTGDFSIFYGTVIRAPTFLNETALHLRSRFAGRLSARGRSRLKAFLRSTKTRIAPQIARIPGVRFAARRVRGWVLSFYIQRYAVAGVLIGADVSELHERIDSAHSDTDGVAARDSMTTG